MDINKLNDMQKEAVLNTEGPMLILAGAGSGKTRVLTHRIAYLLEEKRVFPSKILAITFTNKAAKEMKLRVNDLVGEVSNGMWIGTFHSICVRILRKYADEIGYSSDFVIYDTSDQKTLVKQCMKELNINDKQTTAKSIINKISEAKNYMANPEKFEEMNNKDYSYKEAIRVYKMYQKKLKENNAMDFDDLIIKAIEILNVSVEAREYYQQRFKYVLVDEYQDTNKAQYILIKTLSNFHKNLCVVGDLDQSIYGWRGADIRNIKNFEKDFKESKIIKLEQNYRSTDMILNAANAIIKNNINRKDKNLWTDNGVGEGITYYQAQNEYDEASFVAISIENDIENNQTEYSDYSILYRTNAQSRVFEDAFRRLKIPYKIYGGLKFYDRKEIKDMISYLRIIQNKSDEIGLLRIINVPKRGVGKKTIEKLFELKGDNTLYSVISEAIERKEFSKNVSNNLTEFIDIIENLTKLKESIGVSEILEKAMNETGYLKILKEENSIESLSRIDNLKELVSATTEFERNSETGILEDFLAEISLQSDLDNMDEDEDDFVVMMTIHSAKGLEFPNVFLVGVEENIFPSFRSIEDSEKLEEERRLAYVGITRAEKKLYISHATIRTQYGKTKVNQLSRFIEEIPKEYFNEDTKIATRKKKTISFGMTMETLKERAKENNKIISNSASSDELKVGLKVKHEIFGVGIIVSKTGKGIETVLTIAFENKGIKKLQLGYAPLEIVSNN